MEHDSPDDYDDPCASDGESIGEEIELKHIPSPTSPSAAPSGSSKSTSSKPATHLQKRRRVTRACDECRRKKIKCDGKQPCTHCTVYSYECTYDQPSNRRRNPAPQYVENLEHRVHRAETLLHILIPNLDLTDPGIDAAVAQGWIPGAPGKGNPGQPATQLPQRPKLQVQPDKDNKSDTKIESMVRAVAQIEVDEAGNWDYHGHSSGLSFVRRMREELGDLMGPETISTPFVMTRPMSGVVDSPKSIAGSPLTSDISPAGMDLPPKHIAKETCRCAVEDAAALLRAVHRPTFWNSFERLYTVSPENYTNEDQKFLPLFHSAMALGHLFGKDERSSLHQDGYENAIQQGFVHFKTARQLMDIADCRDLMSIQAVMMMILFLQSSAKLSQCYAYVGVALRSALRMGLHRNYNGNFDPVEAETRKRVFWVVRKMDIYVGAMLGLPQTLSDEDIDQEFPTEVDDEYVTKDGILPMPEGQVSMMTAFNAHTRLVQLLQKIVRYVYPIKVQDKEIGSGDQSYSVPFSAIREIESDLEQWKNDLPPIFNPSAAAPERYTRIQQLLRLSYAHAQVMLYRPFLHFVAMEKRAKPVDQRAYACAASYVNVSRNIIHIQTQMKQKGLLNGAFWFVMYTSFFAVLSLVYFAAENPDNPTTQAIMKDALEGKEVLASLAKRSHAADRCTVTLDVVFQKLPEWMRKGQQNPVMSRKRPHDSGSSTPHGQNAAASRSHPDVSSVSRSEPTPGLQRRAGTFPRIGPGRLAVGGTASPHENLSHSGSSSLGQQTPSGSDFSSSAYLNYNPRSASATMGQGMHQYSVPQVNYPIPAIADLSTMMFPAPDEPFGYPNQPLTTFENNQQFAKDSPYPESYPGIDNTGTVLNAIPQTSGEDNMEAQFYALPPFMGQQQFHGMRPNEMAAMAPGQPFGIPTSPSQIPNGWPGPQPSMQQAGDVGNINIQDIFGGTEWNSVMNGFQPQ